MRVRVGLESAALARRRRFWYHKTRTGLRRRAPAPSAAPGHWEMHVVVFTFALPQDENPRRLSISAMQASHPASQSLLTAI